MPDLSLIGEHVRVFALRSGVCFAGDDPLRIVAGVLVASTMEALVIDTPTDGQVVVPWADVQALMREPACVCSS